MTWSCLPCISLTRSCGQIDAFARIWDLGQDTSEYRRVGVPLSYWFHEALIPNVLDVVSTAKYYTWAAQGDTYGVSYELKNTAASLFTKSSTYLSASTW
jgi:hypothetical protein